MRYLAVAVLLTVAPVPAFAAPAEPSQAASLRPVAFGPFMVIDATRARLHGVTDSRSPQAFERMLRSYPGIRVLEMSYCLGTLDDRANLRLGRMIRASGLATRVSQRGFVGSGAVELFLAGTQRFAAPTAAFGVHSWRDDSGREPADYGPDAAPNRAYIDYYRQMGMSETGARAFYAMTNAVPFASARYLSAAQMRAWIDFELR